MIIECESAAVAHAVRQLADIAVAAGAEIHPDTTFRERSGQLSVHSPLHSHEQPPVLISIPATILVPASDLTWAAGPQWRLLDGSQHLTPLQREVLAALVELYEAASKLETFIELSPKLVFPSTSQTAAALGELRPGFRADRTAAEVFSSTRTLGVKSTGDTTRAMFIPLLELVNHHRKGAGFAMSSESVSLRQVHPTGTSECFASYGSRRDCLDLALNYCYFDAEPTLAKCAPMTIAVPALGSVRVNNLEAFRLSKLNPPMVWRDGDALVINHLTFDPNHPERLQATVALALQSAFLQAGVSDARGAAIDTIHLFATETAQRNRAVIDTLAGDSSAAAHLVRQACERQIDLITQATE